MLNIKLLIKNEMYSIIVGCFPQYDKILQYIYKTL